MRRVCFVLPKHPYAFEGGDTRMVRLLMDICGEAAEVHAIALWSGPDQTYGGFPVQIVPKAPLRLLRLFASSALRNRSLVHTRYLSRPLETVLRATTSDRFVADHSYMAEAVLAAWPEEASEKLCINLVVLESAVLRGRRDALGALAHAESERTVRDEVRCTRSARSTAAYSETELAPLRKVGIHSLSRLDMALPPVHRVRPGNSSAAVFIGDRRWTPNASALEALMRLWPRIRDRVPGASLLVAGTPAPGERPSIDPSVRKLGFVDNVDDLWGAARCLLAPVSTGGGVRVKILEAATFGVPVVGTASAVGDIGNYLPIRATESEAAFVEYATRLLQDPGAAETEGKRLYEANSEYWGSRSTHRQVLDWLQLM